MKTSADLTWYKKPYLTLEFGYIGFIVEGNVSQIREQGKYGLIDFEGNLVMEPIATEPIIRNGLIPVRNEERKIGLMDGAGNLVVDYIGERFSTVPPHFYSLQKGGEVLLFTQEGIQLQTPHRIRMLNTKEFQEGVIAVEAWIGPDRETGSGYIDTLGNAVTEFKYRYPNAFSRGIAAVTEKDYLTKYYIDKQENIVFRAPEEWVSLSSFKGELAMIHLKEKGFGFIDKDFQVKVEPQFSSYSYKEGFHIVSKDNRTGALDAQGNLLVPCHYDRIDPLNDHQFIVQQIHFHKQFKDPDRLWDYENTYTKCAIFNARTQQLDTEFDYEELKKASDNLLIAKQGDFYGYITPTGEAVTPFVFQRANEVCAHKAWVQFEDQWGVLSLP